MATDSFVSSCDPADDSDDIWGWDGSWTVKKMLEDLEQRALDMEL